MPASTDKRFEQAWAQFFKLSSMMGLVPALKPIRSQGLIPDFAARPVAIALNHLDAYTLIEAFGKRPRSKLRTGPRGVGPNLDFHTLWQRVARERVLEPGPNMSRLVGG